MLKIFLLFLFLFVNSIFGNSNISQVPLNNYMQNMGKKSSLEAILDRLFYVNTRCSALYMYIASMTTNPSSEKEAVLNKNVMQGAQIFNLEATKHWMGKSQNDDFDKANLHVFKVSKKMVSAYEEDANNYYAVSGSHLNGYIKSDMKICEMVALEIKKNIKTR